MFFAINCAGSGVYYSGIENKLASGDYYNAAIDIENNNKIYNENNVLLFHLDKGVTFHYGAEYDSSINYFIKAENLIEDLYTKSVSRKVLSFVVNDNILPYEGEDFEKVLINLFLALNFAKKGMSEDALVEARKVDLKLGELSRKYEYKNKYKENAFIRYIAGALYENENELNDAFISYKKSYDAYTSLYEKEYGTPPPSFLLNDLVRTAGQLSFSEEVDRYKSLGGELYPPPDEKWGSIIILVYTGMGPIKREERITVSIPDSSGIIHTFQVALPKFVRRQMGTFNHDVIIATDKDSSVIKTEVVENITTIAEKALEDRLTLIYLKSGGRALLKFLASEKLKKELKKGKKGEVTNILGSLAVDLTIGATEQADLRCWRLIPSEIQMTRIFKKPGKYKVSVYNPVNNELLKSEDVEIKEFKTSFVIVNDLKSFISK